MAVRSWPRRLLDDVAQVLGSRHTHPKQQRSFAKLPRWRFGLILMLVGALAVLVQAVYACPFCGMQGQTLTGEINEASLVIYGTLTNPRLDPTSDSGQGTTDLIIERILKSHEIVEGKKSI